MAVVVEENNRIVVAVVVEENNRIVVAVVVENDRIVAAGIVVVVVEYLAGVIFLHRSHPLQIL